MIQINRIQLDTELAIVETDLNDLGSVDPERLSGFWPVANGPEIGQHIWWRDLEGELYAPGRITEIKRGVPRGILVTGSVDAEHIFGITWVATVSTTEVTRVTLREKTGG